MWQTDTKNQAIIHWQSSAPVGCLLLWLQSQWVEPDQSDSWFKSFRQALWTGSTDSLTRSDWIEWLIYELGIITSLVNMDSYSMVDVNLDENQWIMTLIISPQKVGCEI